jgi:hypothetical protein
MKNLWRTPFLFMVAVAGAALLVAGASARAGDSTGSNPRIRNAPSSVGTSDEYQDCKDKCFARGRMCGGPCQTMRCLFECRNELKICLDNCEVTHR